MARKAARASSGASPRSSTPRPFFESLTEIEKSLRKQKKLLREIDALSSKAPATLNQDQQQKLRRYGEVTESITRLEAALAQAAEDLKRAGSDDSSDAGDIGGDAANDDGGDAADGDLGMRDLGLDGSFDGSLDG